MVKYGGQNFEITNNLIKNVQFDHKCLHLRDNNHNNGNRIHLWDHKYGNHTNQEWVIEVIGGNTNYNYAAVNNTPQGMGRI